MSSPRAREPSDEHDAPQQHADRPFWTQRLAPLFLVAGATLIAGTFLKSMPKERGLELRLEDEAPAVRRLEVTWTDPQAADGDPLQGCAWSFADGTAPRSVHTTVRLPDGPYQLDIEVETARGRTALRRAVTLGDAEHITFRVR